MGVLSRMWVAGCGWAIWVWLVGVVVRRYIHFLIFLTPTPLVTFCLFKKMFFVLVYI